MFIIMKVWVQPQHILEAKTAIFADIDKHFRETKDTLFVADSGKLCGVITHQNYLESYYGDIPSNFPATEIACDADEPFVPEYVDVQTGYSESQRFYCKALAGLSSYNISVNADLSVSCHCVLRNTGLLGSIKEQSLEQIFNSERANMFRRLLYEGRLPTVTCLKCPELTAAPKAVAGYYQKHFTMPKAVMLENTSVCNLRCKNCCNAVIDKATISLQDTVNIAKQFADAGVENIPLFKYGEPFADKQIGEKIDILRKYIPKCYLHTSTNGMLLDAPSAIETALKFNHVTVSLDGFDDISASEFQNGTSFEKVCANMKNLVDERNRRGLEAPSITWKNVLFAWNTGTDDWLDTVFSIARGLGVNFLQFVDGWNVREEEKSHVIHRDDIFLSYMDRYEWQYTNAGSGMYTFSISNNMKSTTF